jgi:hypothetical protein
MRKDLREGQRLTGGNFYSSKNAVSALDFLQNVATKRTAMKRASDRTAGVTSGHAYPKIRGAVAPVFVGLA